MDDTDDVLDMDLIREKINTVRASPVAKAARTACECSELQLTRPPIVLPAIAGDYQESGRPGLRPTHARAVDQQNHRGLSAGASCNCPPAPRANCPSPATMIAWRYLCRAVRNTPAPTSSFKIHAIIRSDWPRPTTSSWPQTRRTQRSSSSWSTACCSRGPALRSSRPPASTGTRLPIVRRATRQAMIR